METVWRFGQTSACQLVQRPYGGELFPLGTVTLVTHPLTSKLYDRPWLVEVEGDPITSGCVVEVASGTLRAV